MKSFPSLLLLSALAAFTLTAETLPFIEDDYAKARAEAQRRKLPMFVDVWAPW